MKALALVESPDHVCYRYRVKAFTPALERAGVRLDVAGLDGDVIRRGVGLARLARLDAILIQRKLLPAWQLHLVRRKTDRLVFDFDDAVLYRDSYDPRGPLCPKRARRFAATVRACDVVIAGNHFLAECAVRAGAKADRVHVIPTCVDTDRYVPADGPSERPGLALVWVGSSSTLRGLEARKPLFERIAREVPGVSLRLIADRGAELGPMPVTPLPWGEETEARDLAAGDVGISLLPDDLWSRGKCGLKVLQYQAAGLPVLANPVGVHPEMVEPGVSGWLPTTGDEWVDAVGTLANDELLRHEMGRAGRASVEASYSVKAWEGAFAATLAGLPSVPSPWRRESAGASSGPRRPLSEGVTSRDAGSASVRGVEGHG